MHWNKFSLKTFFLCVPLLVISLNPGNEINMEMC